MSQDSNSATETLNSCANDIKEVLTWVPSVVFYGTAFYLAVIVFCL